MVKTLGIQKNMGIKTTYTIVIIRFFSFVGICKESRQLVISGGFPRTIYPARKPAADAPDHPGQQD